MAQPAVCTSQNRFISNTPYELQEANYNPISDYQSVPHLSLEKALEKIERSVPGVMADVDMAKKKFKQNTDLNINESAAIFVYTKTQSLYQTLNEALRIQNPKDLEPWFPYLKLFMNALKKLPARSSTIWRGVCDVQGSSFVVGTIHTWWSINSCSINLAVASPFADGKGTLFCIKSIHGRNISKYSAHQDEDEIVLMPGTQLRVECVHVEQNGLSIVQLEECCISPQGKHVMLSYHENNQDLITKIGDSLRSQNIPVWFNEQGDMFNIRDNLAIGVENAAIVFCFLTPEYAELIECRLELQFAQKRSRKIIPCMLSDPNIWKPSGWLEQVIDGLTSVDFDFFMDPLDINYITQCLIYYIQKMPPSSKHILSTTIDKPSYLYEIVKYRYLKKSHIERFMNPAKSFSIEQSYINLVIVKAKDQQEKEKQMREISHDTAILGTYENVYGVKTSIDIKDIFNTCKTHEKQVLVFGRAGIGKSTFCRYIAYQWATGAYWSQYELLVVIQLRNLTTDEYPLLQNGKTYSLIDIVRREVFKNDLSEEDEVLFKKQFDAKKILWILDGYDEIAQNVPDHLKHLLNKQLLETPHHILTSRPYLNTLSHAVQMEITGFTDKNIEQYVYNFFQQLQDELNDTSSKTQSLLKYLKLNPSAFGVAHIPVNLELICCIWSDEELATTENLTITTLYTKMTEWLCRRYLKLKNINIQLLSDDDVYQECHQELAFLQCLAFEAMKANKILVRPPLLKKVLNEVRVSLRQHPQILNFGALKASNKKTGTQIELDKDHYFIHLSFQEYFAAQYLVNQLKGSSMSSAVEFLKYQRYDERYGLMFTFIAGLSCENQIDSTCNIFWDTIQEKPIDLVGIRHMRLIISCLEATYDHVCTPSRIKLLQRIARIIEHNLRLKNQINNNHLLQSLRTAQSVVCDEIIVNMLINLLQSSDSDQQTLVLSFIDKTNVINPSTKLLISIANFVDDKNDNVRESACNVLGNIGQKVATKEVIDKLVRAVTHENEWVRRSACHALENMSEKAATTEVIDKLVTALTDESEWVRMSARNALGAMSEKAARTEVINKLVSALTDENAELRSSACCALGAIGERVATKEVIDKLVNALKDENEGVRRSASHALGNMGEKAAATTQVIDKLVSALTDENAELRSSACDALREMRKNATIKEMADKLMSAVTGENEWSRRSASNSLGKMGEKIATTEVIDKLVTALIDENTELRSSACDALREMGEKAATNEVINKLLSAVTDESEWVRMSACNALGKMGEKAATTEVIDKLVSALTDENVEFRSSACDALREMGEKAATKEVIEKLTSAVTDENEWVRRKACYALREMGEKAATTEVIDKLLSAVTDESEWVRRSACDALGKIDEKVGTKEVIDKLVNALTDEDSRVRSSACDALGNIGEKAATKEVIDKLVSSLTHESEGVRTSVYCALKNVGEKAATIDVIEKILKLFSNNNMVILIDGVSLLTKILISSTLTKLDPEVLFNYYLRHQSNDILEHFSIEQLLNIWLRTENCQWLQIIVHTLLLRAAAVVLRDKNVVVYETKEPIEMSVFSENLQEQLQEALDGQREYLLLSFEN